MTQYDLVIIGGGEAGISGAVRGTELGAKVCLINQGELGGGCVQTGTLPSKTMSNAAHFVEDLKKGKRYGIPLGDDLKASLKEITHSRHKVTMCEVGVLTTVMRKSSIETAVGEARFTSPEAVSVTLGDGAVREIGARRFLIATGSRPLSIPGLAYNGRTVLSSDDVSTLEELPRRLLLVGAGVNGCEYACIFRTFGSDVVLVEKLDRPLWNQDLAVSTFMTKEFKKKGIRFLAQTSVDRVEDTEDGAARAMLSPGEPIVADKVVVGIGRRPNTAGLGLDAIGVQTTPRGAVLVNERMETTRPGIYAAGDVLARTMLSSTAIVEARIAIENAMGLTSTMDMSYIPWGIYTQPEVGAAGLTEEEAQRQGLPVVIGMCGYNDLVRGCLDGNITGFVKLIFEASTRKLVGAHIVGNDAAEIIHTAALSMRLGARAEDFANMVFNHPTYSEALAKASVDALKAAGVWTRTP